MIKISILDAFLRKHQNVALQISAHNASFEFEGHPLRYGDIFFSLDYNETTGTYTMTSVNADGEVDAVFTYAQTDALSILRDFEGSAQKEILIPVIGKFKSEGREDLYEISYGFHVKIVQAIALEGEMTAKDVGVLTHKFIELAKSSSKIQESQLVEHLSKLRPIEGTVLEGLDFRHSTSVGNPYKVVLRISSEHLTNLRLTLSITYNSHDSNNKANTLFGSFNNHTRQGGNSEKWLGLYYTECVATWLNFGHSDSIIELYKYSRNLALVNYSRIGVSKFTEKFIKETRQVVDNGYVTSLNKMLEKLYFKVEVVNVFRTHNKTLLDSHQGFSDEWLS